MSYGGSVVAIPRRPMLKDLTRREISLALGLAGADKIVIGPLAEDQFQRPDDHRLAGAGLAGHPDQPRTDFPGQVIDQRQVFDLLFKISDRLLVFLLGFL